MAPVHSTKGAAGLAAALPGVGASPTDRPVIGVPVSVTLGGIDNGANAAWLAVRILSSPR